ncbi:MAG: NfeD family protein [Gemmatimonadota bacterium]
MSAMNLHRMARSASLRPSRRAALRAARLGALAAGLGFFGATSVAASAAQEAGRTATAGSDAVVYRVPVEGVIDLGLAPYISRSLREAEDEGAVAVVLEIETPGGRVDAAQQIVDAVRDAGVPVYAYVNQRALSAGAMIALATDGIYMRPGSVLGAATPVTGEGQRASEKIVSAMRAEMRALAEQRDLDPRIAEAMVDETIEVEGVIEDGKLLTLTTDRAAELDYAERVDDWDGLLDRIGAAGAARTTTETNWAEALVRMLTHPAIAPFFLTIGLLGLLIELKTPAFGIAGAVGALSLAAFFGSHLLVGLAGWEEIMVLAAGVVLLGIEIFVVPGFGFFGIAGIVGILASIYLSLVGQFATGADYAEAAVGLSATLLLVLVSAWILVRRLPSNRRLLRSGVLLGEVAERDTGYVSSEARAELVGAEGVALSDLRPAGVAEFGDERLDVVAEGGWIEEGTRVRVLHSEGYRVVVRAVTGAVGRAVGATDSTDAAGTPGDAAGADPHADHGRAGGGAVGRAATRADASVDGPPDGTIDAAVDVEAEDDPVDAERPSATDEV